MMWVLRKKKNEKGDLLKYKARAVVCGNQQKRLALASGSEHTLEAFAPATRSATFKFLCAVGCSANLQVRHFDVEAAYLQGKFEGDDGEVFVLPPPDERFFDDLGVPIAEFGNALQKGSSWKHGFTQSEFDPCYFFKKYPDGHIVDLILYVDDCCMADTGSTQADDDLRIFRDGFKLTLQETPKQPLGMNIDMQADGGVYISASAYVKAKAVAYLPKPLADYPFYDTPSTPQLVKDYEIAARKEHYIDPTFQKNYQSKVDALIYAPPCGRPGDTFAIGILARALTFPTKAMDQHANRVLAYMAQNANEGIKYKAQGGAQLVAYSDSDWA
eukprot:690855-Pleurochrysis_carterae.AAC.1